MSNIPEIGDVVFINSSNYTGEATVTYILQDYLFLHSFQPIQCEISEENLHKMDECNHGQTVYRTNLREISSINSMKEATSLSDDELDDYQSFDHLIADDQQGSLFDEF